MTRLTPLATLPAEDKVRVGRDGRDVCLAAATVHAGLCSVVVAATPCTRVLPAIHFSPALTSFQRQAPASHRWWGARPFSRLGSLMVDHPSLRLLRVCCCLPAASPTTQPALFGSGSSLRPNVNAPVTSSLFLLPLLLSRLVSSASCLLSSPVNSARLRIPSAAPFLVGSCVRACACVRFCRVTHGARPGG